MAVSYGACRVMRFKVYCTAWKKIIRKIWEHIEHTALSCLYYAVVFLYLTNYAHVHLTLYTDIFPMIQILSNLFLPIALIMVVTRSNSCIGKNVIFVCSGRNVMLKTCSLVRYIIFSSLILFLLPIAYTAYTLH